MKPRNLLAYLLLNAFVSACVTGTILFFYDRAQRTDRASATIPSLPATPVPSPIAGEIKIDFISIIGAGITESEVVVIENKGDDPVVLTGWYLKGDKGNAYTFPQLTLYKGGTLMVHTAHGADTPTDLYWGRTASAWQPGDKVTLYDAQGVPRAFYYIP
ncbi:MAG: lamin tail domain-containing protein [Anaerolineales bacterium]|nr:lamin tail domain-containing protein [Anaerolineales bacterium]MDP3185133.1 lamin tail domain-containing protein [Anaerolineales bacterium]